jgi:hypothetical protein
MGNRPQVTVLAAVAVRAVSVRAASVRAAVCAVSVCALSAGMLSACSASSGSSAFVPTGGGASATALASAPAAPSSTTPVAGLKSFAFPARIQVEFQTPLPASGPQRAAMIGYENYVDAFWYAVYTHGTSKAYQKYASGNALSFIKSTVKTFVSNDYTLAGTIIYSDISVPQVFYGAGAVVEACVNTAGLKELSASGQPAGAVFSGDYASYQEQASAGKLPDGSWSIGHTESYLPTSGGSAQVCAA